MGRTQDDYRALMDDVEIKLQDEDSTFATVKHSLLNSAIFAGKKIGLLLSDTRSTDALYKFADESIIERRRKLDYSLCLKLQQRYQFAPGNLREKLDHCWNECLSNSFSKYTNNRPLEVVDVLVANPVYDAQLVSIVSEAWQDYLKGIRSIIEKEWKEAHHG